MQLNDFIRTILSSDPNDWSVVSSPTLLDAVENISIGGQLMVKCDSHDTLFTYKNNLDISIAQGLSHVRDFKEDWLSCYADQSASSIYVDLMWCGRVVKRIIAIAVDGGRCVIPLPNLTAREVRRSEYEIMRLLHHIGHVQSSYNEYCSRAGICILDD